jgi:putative PIN family toxin of toxin-antitoxin system
MLPLRIILDTNVLLRSISRRSPFTIILDKLYENSYDLYISNDMQLEYDEKITDIFSKETAELIIGSLLLLPNVKKIDVHFHLGLISTDVDDNKFVDCAFAANAHFLVTDDRHFNALKSITFPTINVISLDEFVKLLAD